MYQPASGHMIAFQLQAEQLEREQILREQEQARDQEEKRKKQATFEKERKAPRIVKPPTGSITIIPNATKHVNFSHTGISASADVAGDILVEYRDGQAPMWHVPCPGGSFRIDGKDFTLAGYTPNDQM